MTRRRSLVVWTAVVVALVALGIVATSFSLTPRQPPASTPVTVGSTLIGKPAPPIDLVDLDGRPVSLSDYLGRPVIVNFWASWCEPCKEEFPLFRSARDEHTDLGLEILGVIHDDSPSASRAFAESQAAAWPMLLDPDDVAYDAWTVLGLPTTYYVDREGIVRAVSFGPPPSGVLEDQLGRIL